MKLPDAAEGSVKNTYLYNDKELFDDGGLNWYDYGYRSYDPQIGRFTQLDPLTWDYPELTNYQYASDEPITNVDMDGLELSSAVKDFTYSYTKTTEFVFPTLAKTVIPTAAKATVAVKTLSALSIGINVSKIGLNVVDHARIVKTVGNLKTPNSKLVTSTWFEKLGYAMNYINDVFHRINDGPGTKPVGSGSHQRLGYVIDGNDGTTDNYTDKADIIAGNIHMGPFFRIMNMNNPLLEDAATNPTIKKTTSSVDAANELNETISQTVSLKQRTKIIRGSGGRQVSKIVWVVKYQIGPSGDTLGNSIDPVNIPVKRGK